MTQFAAGRRAIALCYNCGFQWPRNKLRYQVVNMRPTKELHCPDCLDEDQPQYQISKIRKDEAIAIQQPSPDPVLAITRGDFGWNPIGGASLTITMYPQVNGTNTSPIPPTI